MGTAPAGYLSPWKLPALEEGERGEYLTERLTDAAVEFVRANADRPFFLYLTHYGVYTPHQGPPELVAKYEAQGLKGKRAHYAAMVEGVDQSLGRVLDELDTLDLAENTVVVLLSDNGGLAAVTSMKPLHGQKGTPHEGGVRVPLAVRWPGRVREGAVDKHPVIAMDLFPTLLDAAGVPSPGPVDGESLLPLLLDTGGLDRSALFWHFPAYLERYGGTASFRARPYGAVRMGPWKLIEHFEDGRLELFHLRDDPGEETDLAESKPEKLAELHGQLLEWREHVGAPVPTELEPEYGKVPEEGGR